MTLNAVEGALWDQVVPDLVSRELVSAKDTAELIILCQMWGLYCEVVEKAKIEPTDKEIRCAVTSYFTAFDRVAAKFGLSAADNASVQTTNNKPAENPKVATRVRGA